MWRFLLLVFSQLYNRMHNPYYIMLHISFFFSSFFPSFTSFALFYFFLFSSILSNFYLHFIPCSFNFFHLHFIFFLAVLSSFSTDIFFSPFPSALSYFSLTLPFLAPLVSLKKVCILHLCER